MDKHSTTSHFDGLRNPGFAHTGYRDIENPDLIAHIGMEQMIHQNLSAEMSKMVISLVKMAQDAEHWDDKAASYIYDAITKIGEAQDLLKSDELQKSIYARDMTRRNAYGDYWRRKDRPISRY